MICPMCSTEMVTDEGYQDFACPNCSLAGDREVLDAIARLNVRETVRERVPAPLPCFASGCACWSGSWG